MRPLLSLLRPVSAPFATLAEDGGGGVISRAGNVGPPVPLDATTKVVEFNDVGALEAALAPGDVACVLAEPALTNIGIVLPDPGYHDALRAATRATGTLLIIDETHCICAGPGGATRAWGLEPDILTIGKPCDPLNDCCETGSICDTKDNGVTYTCTVPS